QRQEDEGRHEPDELGHVSPPGSDREHNRWKLERDSPICWAAALPAGSRVGSSSVCSAAQVLANTSWMCRGRAQHAARAGNFARRARLYLERGRLRNRSGGGNFRDPHRVGPRERKPGLKEEVCSMKVRIDYAKSAPGVLHAMLGLEKYLHQKG